MLLGLLVGFVVQQANAGVVSVEIEVRDTVKPIAPCPYDGYSYVICGEMEGQKLVLCAGCGKYKCCAPTAIANYQRTLLSALEYIKAGSTDDVFVSMISEAIDQVASGKTKGTLIYIPTGSNISENEALILFDRALQGDNDAELRLYQAGIRILTWSVLDNKIVIKGWEQ